MVSNKPGKIENDFLEINQIKVILCGSPMIGGIILNAENIYKRLIYLNKHVENLFKIKSKDISKS